MKISVLNLLRGGVFSLAVVAAFAFTQPLKVTTAYGAERNDDDEVIAWHQVDISNPQNYECETNPSLVCIYEEQDVTSPMVAPGKFLP
ncbi:hypothetical protein [Algoriphagus sp. Y33]|uniref:hypothetical protein n=1 Tax=Algoriphagus sp. Y33 TaxID=2772483 RepID=UPI00177BB93C|nr:hypothetical protein [Algoriphagus sp. Y33]